MAAGNTESTEEKTTSASASGGTSKVVLLLSGLNFLVTIGVFGLLFTSFKKDTHHAGVQDISLKEKADEGQEKSEEGSKEGKDEKSEPKKKIKEAGKMVPLEQFTINLAAQTSVSPRFARVNISLEVPSDDTEAELNSRLPQVRNVIIDLFNSKRPSDLSTTEGREYLKEEIRSAINGFLVSGKVKGVYFTNFALAG